MLYTLMEILLWVILAAALGLWLGWWLWGRYKNRWVKLRDEHARFGQELKHAKEEQNRLAQVAKDQKIEVKKAADRVKTARKQAEAAESEAKSLRDGSDQQQSSLQKTIQTLREEKADAVNRLKQIPKLETSVEELEARVTDLSGKLRETQKKNHDLIDLRTELEARLKVAENRLGISNGEGSSGVVEAETESPATASSQRLGFAGEFDSGLKDEAEKVENLEDENARLAAELEAARQQAEAVKDAAQTEVAAVQANAEAAQTEIDKAKAEAEQIKAAAEKEAAELAEKEAAKAQAEIERAKAEAERVKAEADQAKAEAEAARREAEKTRAEDAAKAQAEVDRAKAEADKAKAEAEAAQEAEKATAEEAAKAQAEAESAKADLETAKADFDTAIQAALERDFSGEDVRRDADLGILYSSRPGKVDDLKEISGVGPVIEEKLHDFGVYRFKQIANWNDQIVEVFAERLETFKDRIDRDEWITQAKKLATGEQPT